MPPEGPNFEYKQRKWFNLVSASYDMGETRPSDCKAIGFRPIASYLDDVEYFFKLLRCSDSGDSEDVVFKIGINDKHFAVGGVPFFPADTAGFEKELQSCLKAVFPSVGRDVALDIIPVERCAKSNKDGNVLAIRYSSLKLFFEQNEQARKEKKRRLDNAQVEEMALLFSLAFNGQDDEWLVLLPWNEDAPQSVAWLQKTLQAAQVEESGPLTEEVSFADLTLVPHCVVSITFRKSSTAPPLLLRSSPASLVVPVLSRTNSVTYLSPLALWARRNYMRNRDALGLAWYSETYEPIVVRGLNDRDVQVKHLFPDAPALSGPRPLLLVAVDVEASSKQAFTSKLASIVRSAKDNLVFIFLVASDGDCLSAMFSAFVDVCEIEVTLCTRLSLFGAHLVLADDPLLCSDRPALPKTTQMHILGRQVAPVPDAQKETWPLRDLKVVNMARWVVQQQEQQEQNWQVDSQLGWLQTREMRQKECKSDRKQRKTMEEKALRAFVREGMPPPLSILARGKVASREAVESLYTLVGQRLRHGPVVSTVHVLHCFTHAGASTVLRLAALELAALEGWVLLASGISFDTALQEADKLLPVLLASAQAPVVLMVDDDVKGMSVSAARQAADRLHRVANSACGVSVPVCVVYMTRWWPTRAETEPVANVDIVLSPFLRPKEREAVLNLVVECAEGLLEEITITELLCRDLVHLMDVVALSGTAPRRGLELLVNQLAKGALSWLSSLAALVLCANFHQHEIWLKPKDNVNLADCAFLLKYKDTQSGDVSMEPHWAFSLIRAQNADYYRDTTFFLNLVFGGLQQLVKQDRYDDLKALLGGDLPLFVVAMCLKHSHSLYMTVKNKTQLADRLTSLITLVRESTHAWLSEDVRVAPRKLLVALYVFRSKVARRVRTLTDDWETSWRDPEPTGRVKKIVSAESEVAYRARMDAWQKSVEESVGAAEEAAELKKEFKLETLAPEESLAHARLHQGGLELARGTGGNEKTASALRCLMDLMNDAQRRSDDKTARRLQLMVSRWYAQLRSLKREEKVDYTWDVAAIQQRLSRSTSERPDKTLNTVQPLPVYDDEQMQTAAEQATAEQAAVVAAILRY